MCWRRDEPCYVPSDATFFLTIYDEWGWAKLERFRAQGLRVEVLWERPLEEKGLISAEIRRRMAAGEPWELLVPPDTVGLLKAWGIPARLRSGPEAS